MVRSLSIRNISVQGFRNLTDAGFEFGPRFNVIFGENGQGKTNLLEAVYAVATSRSFRTSNLGDLVRTGETTGSVRACLDEQAETRTQSLGVRAGRRHVRVDGKRPPSLLAYALRTPVVIFHPGEVSLSMGGGAERRRLLDRAAAFVSLVAAEELERYSRALRERQRALETRGPGARDLDDWEELIVRHGLVVMAGRANAAERLGDAARRAFDQIGGGVGLETAYAAGAPHDAAAYRAAMVANRARDQRRGGATVGPHRDDLVLSMGPRPARGFASQGQHRMIVLALKAAEIEVVRVARGTRPILLLDDVSSELDKCRTEALFRFLQRHEGQVILTTTRPELIDTGHSAPSPDRVEFAVSAGAIERRT